MDRGKAPRGGLRTAPEASRRDLIERLYFDLVGLAPSQAEIETFVGDNDPQAYAKLVDRLLALSQFGERWARYWLDVARFADTKGYVFTEDRNFPNAYKYRDWVVDAFNDDMPIDQFMRLQLAADHLTETSDDQRHLAAHGFLTLGRRFINNPHDIVADRIDVVFRGLMGMTVACAVPRPQIRPGKRSRLLRRIRRASQLARGAGRHLPAAAGGQGRAGECGRVRPRLAPQQGAHRRARFPELLR